MSAVTLEVIDIVSRQLEHQHHVDAATRFDALPGCDSLDVMDVIVTVEDRFGIEIPDAALDDLVTVGDLAALVEGAEE